MSNARPSRRGAYSLCVAFLMAAAVAFLGMRWNMLESRWAFPMGTKLMLVAAVVTAGCSRLLGRTPTGATILTIGFAIPAGAFISMAVEMLQDPTAQNLWPASTAVLAVFSLAASAVGTFVGSLVLRLINAKTGTDSGT